MDWKVISTIDKLNNAIRILDSSDTAYDYSCAMLQLPEELVEQVRAYTEEIIDERDLWYGEDGQDSTYGIETDPHITILYGYSTNSIPKISQSFEEYPKDYVDFKLGAINYFKHKGYFVLHIEVVSQDLQKLHNLTIKSGLKIYNFFPKYKPHVTLAYLKSNKIKKIWRLHRRWIFRWWNLDQH